MKHIIILGDGMADEPIASLGGLTPLQYARTPYMDKLATLGVTGRMKTVADGFHPGSEVANMAVLGYDLPKVYEGRGVLEAASIGVDLGPEDMAMRCNLVCVEGDLLKNHSAGHISNAEADELIRFLDEENYGQKPIVTKLSDPIMDTQEGVPLVSAYDFEDYRAKVNRYVNEHGNTLAIYKLTHNIPLAMGDYQELERVLTSELGSKEDYQREFGDTPFGLLIRKIAKMDHESAMQAFSAFINDESLNQKQIAFVHKIINHIELNGYMENVSELTKPPFDKPIGFIKLFDAKTRSALMDTINQVRENAVQVTA